MIDTAIMSHCEEYIDVAYALSETDCDIPEVLKSITSVKIR